MPRGGARPGSGRKKNSPNKRTKAIAEKAAEQGITPLEVMVQAMREVYDKDGAPAAVPFAKECAPYMHPKISNIELTGKNGGPVEYSNLSDSELDRRLNVLIGQKIEDS